MDSVFNMKKGFMPHFAYTVILSSFFLGSSLLYNQFDITGYYTFGHFSFGFHLLMLSCIVFVCSLITRSILYAYLRRHEVTLWQYGVYCFMEIMAVSALFALYTILFKKSDDGYFGILPFCFKFTLLTLIFPYSFLILSRIIRIKNELLKIKEAPADNSLVRFHDEHKRLKLSIAPSSILYVNAEFNYVKIHYLDRGKVREYMLRASMKSLENINKKCLVRCQRSYFVNPEHVTVLRKDPEGFIFAEMNIPEVPAVPVSKQYYDSLSSLL